MRELKNEAEFEKALIAYLSSGDIKADAQNPAKKIWRYEPHIKSVSALWENFKSNIERLNKDKLERALSTSEFAQVKRVIEGLYTPFDAGKFLYGVNGISQIEIDLDDGRHVFLDVFNQGQIGAGNTNYQIVNQITSPAVIAGRQERRFDVTLLINGLPIIQIELKDATHSVKEALTQMRNYAGENQYSGIFSTLQILVAINPNDAKYMANAPADKFNEAFAFRWQDEQTNASVRGWREFCDAMLSIPMAHQMATNFMVLDGTKNRQSLKVMRPYQVYATRAVIKKIKEADFELANRRLGYVWHTTGSGKTITSFKTAWLASRLPNVDRVVFVVDRVALTNQTFENYRAYNPDGDSGDIESVKDTKNTRDLRSKLKSSGTDIIVTSIQKLARLASKSDFTPPDKNIVFIFDEAHRSTSGGQFRDIWDKFKKALFVGYTGTPEFSGLSTKEIFGELLHAYTIKEAIADKNVLGFNVKFKSTVDIKELLKKERPELSEAELEAELEAIRKFEFDEARFLEEGSSKSRGEKIESTLKKSFYDQSSEHIRLVVDDIVKNWRNRSNDFRYNAIFTTHVSGAGASTPLAIKYYNEFKRANKEAKARGEREIKVAISYSASSDNGETMIPSNNELLKAMEEYNALFGTSWGLDRVDKYFEDLASRLNKSAKDEKYLDLVIVVDQLLTGFDAPSVNTLYVDRVLKGAGLIQAYSRTNRVENIEQKPWGNIINYRWPAQNERLMNEALATYANKASANLSDEQKEQQNIDDGIIAKPFGEILNETKECVKELAELTTNSANEPFSEAPKSEEKQLKTLSELRRYSGLLAKLKQYEPSEMGGFSYDKPEELLAQIGITEKQHEILTLSIKGEIQDELRHKKGVEFDERELVMTHIKDVSVDYDYLTELINRLIKECIAGQKEQAKKTASEINKFAYSIEEKGYAQQIRSAVRAIEAGEYPQDKESFKELSVSELRGAIIEASGISVDRKLLDFRNHWGITDVVSGSELKQMFAKHRYGDKADLDEAGALTKIITQGSASYSELATDIGVQKLSKIKYRNELREAFYVLADEMGEGENE